MALDDYAIAEKTEAVDGEDAREAQPESRPDSSGERIEDKLLRWSDPAKSPNIADEIIFTDGNDHRISEIGMRVVEEANLDDRSRDDWMERTKKAMDLALLVAEKKAYPWPDASNVVYPLMTIAAIQFAARAYPAIIQDRAVVRGVVFGNDDGTPAIDPNTGQQGIGPDGQPIWAQDPSTGDVLKPGNLRSRADRIAEHMSWQFLEEQPEWVEETDKLLHILPIVGCAFRKTFFDRTEMRNTGLLVFAKNLIINYWAKSLETAPRLTEEVEYYPYEMEELIRAGVFLDQDYGEPEGVTQDRDAPHTFLEQHRRLDLDGDGYTEPYIVTVHKTSQKVARIVSRYDPAGVMFSRAQNRVAKIIPVHYYTKYDFLPNPDGGIYGVGFGQLLGPMNQSVNSSLNMMFDAAHLQNSGGGFIGKGLSMHTGAVRMRPGEYKQVNAPGRTIREAIVPLEHGGPSPVLFQLLGFLVDAAKDVASVKDILTGERMAANTPATTIMALIEQGLSVFTAIYKRVHHGLKNEYGKQYRLNRIYLEESATFMVGPEAKEVRRIDYMRGNGVVPVSDPKSVSNMQRLAKAEFLKQFANDPLCDGSEIRRRMFEAAAIEDIDEVLRPNPPPDAKTIQKEKELAIKEIGERALAFANMALAIERMSKADLNVAENFRVYVETQMNALQSQMETIDGSSGAGPAAPAGSPGGPGGSVPTLAPPPGNAAPPSVPQ